MNTPELDEPGPKKNIIGRMVYDRAIRARFPQGRKRSGEVNLAFRAVVAFWNKQTGEKWRPGPDPALISDKRLVEVGWFIYQRACVLRSPSHKWASRFRSDVKIPKPWRSLLSLDDLAAIERKANNIILVQRFIEQSHGKRLSYEQVAAFERESNCTLFPIRDLEMPKRQESVTLAEAIVALAAGRFSDIDNDTDAIKAWPPTMPYELGSLAARVLFHAASKGQIDIRGIASGKSEPQKIDASLFRDMRAANWLGNAIDKKPKPSDIDEPDLDLPPTEKWSHVYITAATLKTWLRQIRGSAPDQTLPRDVPPAHRPEEYRWNEFDAVLLQRFEDEGDFSKKIGGGWYKQAAINEMMEWCERQKNWSSAPSRSSVRDHVEKVRQRFLAGRKGQKAQ